MKKTEQPDNIKLLIINWLSGSINKQDLESLKQWINAAEDHKDTFNELKDAWIVSGMIKDSPKSHNDVSWEALKNRITLEELRHIKEDESKQINYFKYFRVAASWLLIFVLGSALTWWLTDRTEDAPAKITYRSIEVTTPLGARSIIRMPDSTQIWLNAGTTITYSQDYGIETRTLNLTGEAFFDVSKDTIHPFIINTQGIIVRALGTRFNVKSYPEERTISATLEEGKIDVSILSLNDKNKSLLLKPKDKLIYNKETNSSEKFTESPESKIVPGEKLKILMEDVNVLSDVRTELYTSWKDQRWIIDSEPLRTLAPMLERRFNLKIIFEDKQLMNYKFTGTIENETVNQLMNALRFTAPLDYKISRDTLRLTLNLNSKEEFKRIMLENN